MGWIILILANVVVVALAFGNNPEKDTRDGDTGGNRSESPEADKAAFLTAMMIGKALTDTTRRLNNWDKQRDQREKEKWAWQEKVRRENPSFNDHYDYDF